MMRFDYHLLEELVNREEYDTAEQFCVEAAKGELDPQFWETQLGYLYFLNERDLESYYKKAPSMFERLVARNSDDANARFWLGYLYEIVLCDSQNALKHLREVLAKDADHPYANLVISGLCDSGESVTLLKRALTQQPTNFRVLRQLSDVLIASSNLEEGREVLRQIIEKKPYLERSYGIMNRYINDVLTGATHEVAWREQARTRLVGLK
jgi:tetratricopeptide (TPR) repeat protein